MSLLEIKYHKELYEAVDQWLDELMPKLRWEYNCDIPNYFFCFLDFKIILWYNPIRGRIRVRPCFVEQFQRFYLRLGRTPMSETELADDIFELMGERFELGDTIFRYDDSKLQEEIFEKIERGLQMSGFRLLG